MKVKVLKTQLIEQLAKSGWDRVLSEFIKGQKGTKLFEELFKAHSEGGITPKLSQVFNAFKFCPYDELKLVIVGQDPYPGPGVADGIAFSSGNTLSTPVSLRYIFNEIKETHDADYDPEPSLIRWSEQGILMLNTALTTTPGKIGEHYEIWRPFVTYLFEQLVERNNGLIYVFMGSAAKEWHKMIPETNYKLYCYHPASAAYNGGKWDSNDVFNRVNDLLFQNNNTEIKW